MRTRWSRNKVLAAVLALAVSVVTLAGCGSKPEPQGAAPAGAAPAAEKTLKIGIAVSLTGNFAKEGTLMKQGYEYWQEKVNAAGGIKVGNDTYKVSLVMYDDKSDVNTSVKLTEKLITEDKVHFLFGPYSSGVTQATSAIAEKYKMVNFAVNANAPNIYDRGFKYVFGLLPLATNYLDAVLEFAAGQNPKPTTVAIISPDNLFALAAMEGAKKKAESLGLQVVYSEKFPADVKDLSSVLSQVKSKNPDLLLSTGFFQDGSLVVKQLKDLNWKPKLLGFTIATSVPDFRNTLGADAENISGAEWWTGNMKYQDAFFGTARQYADAIKQKHSIEPSYHVANASLAGYVLQKAIEKAGSVESEKVREALTQIELDTFFGKVKFDEAGRNVAGTSVAIQIQNGELMEIYPAQYARGKGIYPMNTK